MPWIDVIRPEAATGMLKKLYDTAKQVVNKVNIMFGSSPLSRGQREMLAVIVSARNDCLY